jgi:hypothetical protein
MAILFWVTQKFVFEKHRGSGAESNSSSPISTTFRKYPFLISKFYNRFAFLTPVNDILKTEAILFCLRTRRHDQEDHCRSTCENKKSKTLICIHALSNALQTSWGSKHARIQRVLSVVCFSAVFFPCQGNVSASIGGSTQDSSCTVSWGHVTNDVHDVASRRLLLDPRYHFHSRHTLVRRRIFS